MKWLYVALLPVAAGFVPGKPVAARFVPGIAPMVGLRRAALRCVVTEDDVEKAVEKAEKLWADALAARKKADALSAEAEEMATAAATVGEEQSAKLGDATRFEMSLLSGASQAMSSSLQAGEVLSDAVEAAEEAQKLEDLAEAALAESEAAIEAHLADFPDAA